MSRKVSIKTENGITRILVDGQEIKGVTAADVSFRVNELPLLTLQLLADEFKIEADDSKIIIGGEP